MTIEEASTIMEGGFCLWVGAGLTKQILADKKCAPLWPDLTIELEEYAGLAPGQKEDTRYPQRLGIVFEHLRYDGPALFRAYLRKRLYTEVCVDLLRSAHQGNLRGELIPARIRQVASLGQLANPIVSFNVEPLSSLLLARPAGPIRPVPYSKGKPGEFTWREPFGTFQRLVYHPHGLITTDPVMTESDYDSKNATLAFGLAIHLAFGSNLAIVGMSLDDEFLKKQIEDNRRQIKHIFWFNSSFDEKQSAWLANARVSKIRIPWKDFWAFWAHLPVAIDEAELHVAWWLALDLALEEVRGGHLTDLAETMRVIEPDKVPRFLELAKEYGEPGAPIDMGFDARAIANKIKDEIQAKFKFKNSPSLHYSGSAG